MAKKQQLYIKNSKGRYEPYEPPKVNVSDNLYVKVGRKYVPYGRRLNEDYLTDGVYVVRCDKQCGMRSIAAVGHLEECYRIDKVSNNYRITTEQLASLEDYFEFALGELRKLKSERNGSGYGLSTAEEVACVIGSVFKFSEILKKRIEEEKTEKRANIDTEPTF
ncbi:MAG: hypothetical protein IIT64_10130 [Bacteroidaceae bacterium]|nr:hypothetical protein [Bacteroidaceae bacterium]